MLTSLSFSANVFFYRCVLSQSRRTNLCIRHSQHLAIWPYLVPGPFFSWLQFGFLRSKQKQPIPISKQAPSCLVESWLAKPPVWLGTDYGYRTAGFHHQPNRGGKGETLGPGAALGNRGTRGVDAVELEATGGSRPHRCGFFWFLRAQRGGNYNLLPPLPCPCSCGPRRLGRLPGGFESAGTRFRWVSATRSGESPDSTRWCW